MLNAASTRFARLPTAAKLLLILTAALLPIGLGLMWYAERSIQEANDALRARSGDYARNAAEGIERLIARKTLALRIAANGALATGTDGACERMQRSLAIAPGLGQRFQLHDTQGQLICAAGEPIVADGLPLVAPGNQRLRVGGDGDALVIRVGVPGGMATTAVPLEEVNSAARQRSGDIASLTIADDATQLRVFDDTRASRNIGPLAVRSWPVGDTGLTAQIEARSPRISTLDRLILALPLLMWVLAAMITWLVVTRLLIRPLRQLGRAVTRLQPGQGAEALPRKLGPSMEIQGLRDAFGRALDRIEQSEHEMAAALEGQRRLVREVHHRVKNNLQVVASLLNIHGRSAETVEARAAYAGIARRVGALSIVHRNHFAEMEESRGIALRPLIAELAAELRAGAPEEARGLTIDLDVAAAYTTQDAAVAVAFLITEMVEFAMLNCPEEPIEIELKRTSELTARLSLSSPILVPEEAEASNKIQFERIIAGLAKQLRSSLEQKLGRYSVELPIFPPD
jgi:two-component sensor histidine kinase